MRGRLIVLAALATIALEVCWTPAGGGKAKASAGHQCNVATPAITIAATRGQERFVVVSWDEACHVQVSAVMDATPDLIAKYHLHDHGQATGPAATAPGAPQPATRSKESSTPNPNAHGNFTSTCRTSQSLHDVATLVLTEDDVYQTWSYTGVIITSLGSGHTGTSYLPDGWQVAGTSFSQSYTGWPYTFIAVGGAAFVFTFGTFGHTQTNQDLIDAFGGCAGKFNNSGTAGVPSGYYTYDISVS